MKHEFTLEITIGGRFCTTADIRAEINTALRQWSVDDLEFWDCVTHEWVALDGRDPMAIAIEKQARAYLERPRIRTEIDDLVGHHLLDAGIIPVPEYEHLTHHDYGLSR